MPRQELIDWLNDQLEKTNLSQSEASRRAGLGPNAISEIINGRTPGLKVCVALADLFGFSPEYVLRLAGHLPEERSRDEQAISAQAIYLIHRLRELLALLPRDQQERIMANTIFQAEILAAAAEATEQAERVQGSSREMSRK